MFNGLQALILVHIYRFTNLDTYAPFTDLQESDLQALICVHLYRFRKNQIMYIGHFSTASGAPLRN